MHVESLTPEVDARPGTDTSCRIRVRNDGPRPASYVVSVHGLTGRTVPIGIPADPVAPGGVLDVEVALSVPLATAAGSHAVAVEMRSDQLDDPPAMVGVTIVVSSLDQVIVRVDPDVIKGRGRTRFVVDVINRRTETTALELAGFGRDLEVELARRSVVLEPGAEVRVKGSVKAPRYVTGHPRQHVLTIAARGTSSPTFSNASFQQKALLPVRLRAGVAMFVVVTLWALIALWGVLLFNGRDSEPDERVNGANSESVTTTPDGALAPLPGEGDGPDGDASGGDDPAGGGSAGDGDSEGDGGSAGDGAGGASGGSEAAVTSGVIAGKVTTPDPADSIGVTLRLTDLAPGDTDSSESDVSQLRLVGSGPGRSVEVAEGEQGPTKYWPALYGTYRDRSTMSLPTTTSIDPVVVGESDGQFAFPAVPLTKSYRLTASRTGFDTQAFVVRANADGSTLELDITMVPGRAEIGGRVLGPDGAGLGGVALRITDGDLEFEATSSTDPDNVGVWSVAGLSTPATYTIIATRLGLATSVQQVRLGNGESNTNVAIRMQRGVGTITGVVRDDKGVLGGVEVLVTSGEFTRSATTATQGLRGLYEVPALPLGSSYVVAVSAPGYLPQAQEVTLTTTSINRDVPFTLTPSTGSITGRVRSVGDAGSKWLSNASVTVTGKDTASQTLTDSDNDTSGDTGQRFVARKMSVRSGDPGSFTIDDLPPGEYLVSFDHYQHRAYSRVVRVRAGAQRDMKVVDLEVDDSDAGSPPLFNLPVSVFEVTEGNGRAPLAGWTVEYDNVARSGEPYDGDFPADAGVVTKSAQSIPLPVGTYNLVFSRKNYRDLPVRGITVGSRNDALTIVMLKLGEVNGYLYDASRPPTEPAAIDAYDRLTGYEIEIWDIQDPRQPRVRQTLSVEETASSPLFQSFNDVAQGEGLVSGPYELRVRETDNPSGYYVDPAQVLRRHETVGLPVPLPKPGMRFDISPDSDEPIGPLLVKAYRYPEVKVQVDLLADGTRPAPTVTVGLSCAGTPTLDATLPAISSGATTTFDFEAMDPLFQGRPGLTGCVVTATTTGRFLGTRTSTFPLDVDLTGRSVTDRLIKLWLVQDDLLGGTVKWPDAGTGVPVPYSAGGGTISRGRATIGFTTLPNGTREEVFGGPISKDFGTGASSEDGSWLFGPGEVQVWGSATYTVAGPDFTGGTFHIVIDDTGTSIENDSPDTLHVELVAKNQIQITTLEPDLVEFGGSYSVVSTTPDLSPIVPTASSGPLVGTIEPVALTDPDDDPDRTAAFRVVGCPEPRDCATGVAPGTWNVEIPTPTGHRLVGGVDVDVVQRLEPGDDPVTLPRAEFVELAQVTLSVTEPFRPSPTQPVAPTDEWPADEAPVVIVQRVTTDNSGPLIGNLPEPAGYPVQASDGSASIVDLAVDPGDPRGADAAAPADPSQTATYRLRIADDDDHVFAEAKVTIDGDDAPVIGGWATFDAHPGASIDIDIEFHRLGTLTGSVLGYVNGITSSIAPSGLTVTYRRVQDGELVGPTSTTITTSSVGFTIAAASGCYQVIVTHPGYEERETPQRPSGPRGPGPCPDVDGVPSYFLASRADSDFSSPFGLDAVRSAIVFTVKSAVGASGEPVDNSTITVVPPSGTVSPSYVGTTTTTGRLDTGAVLWPGRNRVTVLTVSRTPPPVTDPLTPPTTTNFPVIFDIDVPFGGGSRDVEVYAVPVGGRIEATGQIKSVNSSTPPRGIDMPPTPGSVSPAPTAINVTRSFNGAPPVVVSAGSTTSTIVNTAGEIDLPEGYRPAGSANVVNSAGSPATSGSLTFDKLPRGTHVLTFPAMPGYSPDAPFNRSVTVGITGTVALDADVVYTAKNVSVQVRVSTDKGTVGNLDDDDPVSTAVVTLAAPLPDGSGWAQGVEMTGGTNGIYTLANVVPEITEYRLSVTLRRHAPLTNRLVRIVPQAGGSQTLDPVLMSRAEVEIRGTVVRLDSTGGALLDPPNDATVTLRNMATGTVTAPVGVRNGRWSFDVPVGEYTVETQATGYVSASLLIPVTTQTILQDGLSPEPVLELRKRLSFAFFVTSPGIGGINDATVTLGRGTAKKQTVSTSGGSVTVVATAGDPMNWAVTKPSDGFGPESGTASTSSPTIDVVLRPSIRGGIVRVNGTVASGVTVHRCTSSVPAATCGAGNHVDSAVSTTGGLYTFRAAPGVWNLRAIDAAGNSGTGTITVLPNSVSDAAPLGGSMSIDGTTAVEAGPTLSIATAPAGLLVTPGATGTTATATWTTPANLTTRWRYSTSASVPATSDCAAPTSGFESLDPGTVTLVLGDLVPATSYTFEACSVLGDVVSTVVQTTFVTLAVPPPTALALVSVTQTGMTAQWTPTQGVVYEARIYVTGATAGAFTGAAAGTRLFSGLSPNTEYTVDVRATITTASGTYTSEVASRTETTQPAPASQ
jgi:hypothetical protein